MWWIIGGYTGITLIITLVVIAYNVKQLEELNEVFTIPLIKITNWPAIILKCIFWPITLMYSAIKMLISD